MLESLLNKIADLQACNLIKNLMFSCDYSKILKNIYSEKHLQMAAFEI